MTKTPGTGSRLRLSLPDADRLVVIISDIEMGAGGRVDDFPHSDLLGELLAAYSQPPFDELPVDLVFNGDTFDLLKTSYGDSHPRHITTEVALGKLARICAAHPHFFAGVRSFLSAAKAERKVHFVIGNHDPEIVFPEVQQVLRGFCGKGDAVFFPGFSLRIGGLHVEHGHQYDPLFAMDPEKLFVPYEGETLLNISWGSGALLDTVIPLQELFGSYDRIKPKAELFELVPDMRELLVSRFWSYWTRDYWKDWFGRTDPTKKVSWTMLKELAYRFSNTDPEVSIDDALHERLMEDDEIRVVVIGHLHQPAIWSYGDRKLIQNGCLRNEYMIADEGHTLRPIAKSYSEVFLRHEVPVVSHLVEFEAPPAPEGYLPVDVFEAVPEVRKLLRAEDTAAQADEREKQEAREEKEAAKAAKKGGKGKD